MPELPEVQTVVADLNKKIKGDIVVSFWSDWPKAIKNSTLEKFKKTIKNRKILNVRRIGKNIFIDLSNKKTLYIHLKMTGHLLVKPKTKNKNSEKYFADKVNQYIHHIWKLKSGKALAFSDLRKFGKIVLDDTSKIENLKEVKALGVDAVSADFTFRKFEKILNKKSKTKISLLLMDQSLIAGIGNIYRSEILFEAKIHPEKVISEIKEKDRKKLYSSIKKVLKKAIKLRGTSDSDYRDTSGVPGGFQNVLKVYRREGKKCFGCKGKVKRITLGQRSVFLCEKCQKQ